MVKKISPYWYNLTEIQFNRIWCVYYCHGHVHMQIRLSYSFLYDVCLILLHAYKWSCPWFDLVLMSKPKRFICTCILFNLKWWLFKFYLSSQEYVVRMVVKLLSPPLPSNSSTQGSMSHYLAQMSTLNALLLGISYGDAIHIISLYGMVSNTSCTITCTIYSQNIKLVNVLHSFFYSL